MLRCLSPWKLKVLILRAACFFFFYFNEFASFPFSMTFHSVYTQSIFCWWDSLDQTTLDQQREMVHKTDRASQSPGELPRPAGAHVLPRSSRRLGLLWSQGICILRKLPRSFDGPLVWGLQAQGMHLNRCLAILSFHYVWETSQVCWNFMGSGNS